MEFVKSIGGCPEILGREGILGFAETVPDKPEKVARKNPKQTNAIQVITRKFFMVFPSWVKDYADKELLPVQRNNSGHKLEGGSRLG